MFQRRVGGSVDFNRTWADYKHGFGSFLTGEFWLGLDKIHRLTRKKKNSKLRVELGVDPIKNVYADSEKTVYAEYGWFGIANETEEYRLNIGHLSNATVNDSLRVHNGSKFSTCGQNHNCQGMENGWWSANGHIESNLNRVGGIHWGYFNQSNAGLAPETSEMKIRPVAFSLSK